MAFADSHLGHLGKAEQVFRPYFQEEHSSWEGESLPQFYPPGRRQIRGMDSGPQEQMLGSEPGLWRPPDLDNTHSGRFVMDGNQTRYIYF